MPTFNFTVRATDDLGAYADRNFSINVRNTVVDRFCVIEQNNQNDVLTSTDGVSWTRRENALSWGTNSITAGVIYGNGTWLAYKGGSVTNAVYKLSEDAINWVPYEFKDEQGNPISVVDLHSVQFVNGMFCFISRESTTTSPVFYTSIDGKVWLKRGVISVRGTTSIPNPTKITYGNGVYWIGNSGSPSNVFGYKSLDGGLTWEEVILPGFSGWNTYHGINYLNGMWITFNNISSGVSEYATSNDGIIWTKRSITMPTAYTRVNQIMYGNGRIVLLLGPSHGSYTYINQHVLTSEDGLNWAKRSYTPISRGAAPVRCSGVYNNGLFILGFGGLSYLTGHTKGIRVSPDGVNWTEVANSEIASVLSIAAIN